MMSFSGMSSGARGLIPKSAGGRMGLKVGVSAAAMAAGYVGVNAYANDRDASQVNGFGAFMLGGHGGTAALIRNRKKQGHSTFTRPGSVNNHLFPGGGDQGIG
jgi:hypothetical protein